MSQTSPKRRLDLDALLPENIGLPGKILLIDLWSYTSLNCLDRLPFMRGMWARYGHLSFLPVGVHVPEYEFSKGKAMLERAVSDMGVEYLNHSDDEKAIWDALARPSIPSRFLFDAKGALRFSFAGLGGEREIEAWVIRLLREMGADLPMEGVVASKMGQSRRIEVVRCGALQDDVGNDTEGEALKECAFHDVAEHELGLIYLDGCWVQELDHLVHADTEPGFLVLRFEASGLWAVLSSDAPAELEVSLDGARVPMDFAGKDISFNGGRSFIKVGEGALHQVLDGLPPGAHELLIKFDSPAQRIFSLTCVF